MVEEVDTAEEFEEVRELTDEERQEIMKERLRESGVPEEVIDAIPKWKTKYKIRVAFLNDSVYIYRKLLWGELKDITRIISNLNVNGDMTDTNLNMADLEFQLEKAMLYPKMTVETASKFPAGDMETLQALINEFSGYTRLMPVVEDL